ncbi:MAG: enoyl-CoA hydratase-related protein, partial [Chloroflexota bacterium]|nr:enoyl-CoA hydratase-related protein [Chloroflexota bacterium]
RIIDAKEAKEIGLVNQVVPAAELKAVTYDMARTIAQMAPLAIQLGKRALYQGLDADLASQLQFESLGMNYLYGTEDHREGSKAFVEKRQPKFQGK